MSVGHSVGRVGSDRSMSYTYTLFGFSWPRAVRESLSFIYQPRLQKCRSVLFCHYPHLCRKDYGWVLAGTRSSRAMWTDKACGPYELIRPADLVNRKGSRTGLQTW